MPKRKRDSEGNEILTNKEKLFVEGVAQGKSLTEAALNAGYSPDSAHLIGAENHAKPIIQRAVQQRIKDITQADTNEVLQLFAAHLRGDVADFADLFLEDGRLDLDEAQRRGISRLIKKLDYEPVALTLAEDGRIITRYRCKVEFHNSQSAASKLADMLGIKQQPRENEHDIARKADVEKEARQVLADLVTACNGDQDRARQLMAEHAPKLHEYIN